MVENRLSDQHIYLNGEFLFAEPISTALYIVKSMTKFVDKNDRIDIIRLDEHEKRAIMVNVEFKYETLEAIEEFFIENYGYRFEKVKK